MHLDVLDLRNFYYRTQLGRVAQRAIRDQVVRLWPPMPGQTVVGFGFAVPLLRPYLAEARRVIGLMPGPQGVMPWPAGMENVSVLCEETQWPLPTGLVDRLVLMHGLETSEQSHGRAGRGAPGAGAGRAGAVRRAEPRRGCGRGAMARRLALAGPIRCGQLEAQLKQHGFTPERSMTALFAPPSDRRFWLRTSEFWESTGAARLPWLAGGVLMVEASKQVYAPTRGGLGAVVRRPLRVLEGVGRRRCRRRRDSA